ncbi:MAG: glutathione S-transferase family protein [Myxococcales bacterium]|nr:glutathione S-transferase family protein [Myxococcales bacterium]
MATLTLYQFELCPFCHKVKAGLDVKGVAYTKVEVNPRTKRELPPLPADAPKKVPVVAHGDDVVYDSTRILEWLDEAFDGPKLLPEDEAARARAREVEAWVDDELAMALPTVIYGTWGEALKAAQVTAKTSNFGFLDNVGVRAGGPVVMHFVAKRILGKRNKTDGHAWMKDNLDQLEAWLDGQPFVAGDAVSLGDVAVHGALKTVSEFPVFASIMARPTLRAWYDRVEALRN